MCWILFICKGLTSFIESINQSGSRKKNICWYGTQTTQNLNIYLYNYQTETAIFLATKHEKTIMACSYLNFSMQKIHQNSKKWWLLWGIAQWKWLWGCFNQFLLLWIYYSANASEAVQKRRLAQARTLLELCQLTNSYFHSYTYEKTYFAVYYLLIGDTSQVSTFFQTIEMGNLLHAGLIFNH